MRALLLLLFVGGGAVGAERKARTVEGAETAIGREDFANFVAAGTGIKEGVVLDEISARDVAPTIAALPGLEMKNVEGRVLTEVLED